MAKRIDDSIGTDSISAEVDWMSSKAKGNRAERNTLHAANVPSGISTAFVTQPLS